MNDNTPRFMREIRSFVLNRGRLTEGQRQALEHHWGDFGLAISDGPIDFKTIFGNDAPVIFEIGYGMGQSLVTMATEQQDKNFIGVEVHQPGVGRLLRSLHDEGIKNVRSYKEDAIEILKTCIPDESLAAVHLYFPDPWHKKKHHKRRIVQDSFAELVANKLSADGYLHMATDWEHYAEHMMEVMSRSQRFSNRAGTSNYADKPDYRPETKFEARGKRLGHGVWDLVFDKIKGDKIEGDKIGG